MLAIAFAGAPSAVSAPRPPIRQPVYGVPMTTIQGRGAASFHITLGMLVTADLSPVGLYRDYPSNSSVPLSEKYNLAMLESPDGVILSSYGDLPLLVLRGHVGSAPGVYPLSLAYLTNAMTKSYATCTIRIAYTPGIWKIVDRGGNRVVLFVVTSRQLGITSIQPCGD